MQEAEIPAFRQRVIGYREHRDIVPQSAYLLSDQIFGTVRDPARHRQQYALAAPSRQRPQAAKGRMAWTWGWPIIRVTASTGRLLITARRFIDACELTGLEPADVFEQDTRGLLHLKENAMPGGLAVAIVHDARTLVPPTGKSLSGTRAEKMPKLEGED